MNGTRSLAEAANDDFNGVTADELGLYCEQLNIPTRKNSTLAWMESQVRAAIEAGAKIGIIESTTKAPRPIQGKKLNLRPTGRWEGRRRLVTLQGSEQDIKSHWKVVSWDGNQIFIKTEMEVSIPYPHYEILRNAAREIYTVNNVWVPGVGIERQEHTRFISALPYHDGGDDPATAGLPISFIARAQDEARAKNYYHETPRKHLLPILNELTDNMIKREDIKEMSDEEIREQIMNKLGLYEEVQATDFYLDNVA